LGAWIVNRTKYISGIKVERSFIPFGEWERIDDDFQMLYCGAFMVQIYEKKIELLIWNTPISLLKKITLRNLYGEPDIEEAKAWAEQWVRYFAGNIDAGNLV
jgi:hypothetical protein